MLLESSSAKKKKKGRRKRLCTFINISSYSIYIYVYRLLCSESLELCVFVVSLWLVIASAHALFLCRQVIRRELLGMCAPEPSPAAIFVLIVVCSGAMNCT